MRYLSERYAELRGHYEVEVDKALERVVLNADPAIQSTLENALRTDGDAANLRDYVSVVCP